MVVPAGEWDERITRILRSDPHRTVALPFSGENILRKSGKQVSRQRRLFERESVKGAWNDDERAVGNLEPQGIMKRARGKKVELAVQDDRRNADRMQLRRQRFEFEK